jgi:putative NIF3 family GTP cyclohydrolase 1 type 2
MADAIGSVRATFTASAAGLLGAIGQSVSGFGQFAASAKRTAAQQADFQTKMAALSAGMADGSVSVEDYATAYTRLQTRFKGAVSEADRIKAGLDALRGSQAAASMSAEQYAEAEAQVVASAKAATPALEKLKNELSQNKADFFAGKISVEEYRDAIARLPGAINGSETDQQAFNRVLQETRGVMAEMEAPTAKYEKQLATLDDALQRGIIDDQQYAAATKNVQDAMAAADPAAKALADTMARGKAVTEANLTATEKYDAEVAELRDLLSQGAISQETFTRAVAAANPETKKLAEAMERGKQVTESNRTATEKYEAELADLRGLLAQGAISQETFARASGKAEDALKASDKGSKEFADGMSALPGPIGAAARALNSFGGGLQNVIKGFSGGPIAGLKGMFSGVGEGLSNAFSSGGASLAGIAPQLAVIGTVAAGTIAAVVRLTGALGAVGAEVERTQQLATRLGVSFQEYETLKVAASNAGVEVESLAGAQTKFLKAVSEARGGAKEQAAAFAAIGISQREIETTNPNELLEQAAQKLNAIEDPATRAALAMKLFGKSGNDVLPALAGIEETRNSMAKLGGTMSQVDVSRFSKLDDAFDKVGVASARLGTTLLAPFTELFSRVASGLAATVGGLSKAFAPIGNIFAEIGGAAGLFVERIGEGVGLAGRLVGALLQMSGITVIASAIGAAVDQWSGAFNAVDSYIEPIVAGLEQVAAFVSDNILRGITAVYTIFGNLVSSAIEWVSQSGVLSALFGSLAGGANMIYEAFKSVGGWVSYVVEQLEAWAGIEPPKTTSPADKEAIEAQMKAKEDAEKAEADRQKKAEDRAKTIKEDLLSPYEKMQEKIAEVNDLEQRGLLTAEQRAAAEAKVRDEFAKQDPLAQSAAKYAEEQKKASADISKEIEKSAKAGKDLGAAGQDARDQFASAAGAIKDKLDKGLIDPEEARKQMSEAADAMNEELKRVGEDLDFAKKIREGLQTEGQKVAAEIKKIDENKSLTEEEKDAAKKQVRDKLKESLPGGGEETLADKFNKDRQKLQDAFDNGVIDSDELEKRTGELKKKLTESLPGKAEQDASDKFRESQEQLRDALDEGIIDPEQFKERMGNLRSELEDSVADEKDKRERNAGPDRRANQAVDVNSSEGASTFFRLLRGQDDPTKKQLKEMEKQTRLLAKVADDLADTEVIDI